MFARALFAFVAMPGMVSLAIPATWAWQATELRPIHPLGLLFIGAGQAALLWCVRDFYHTGKGTLAPWAPPRHLVRVGLYRLSRNPMYLAVTLMLLGWATTFASTELLLYALLVLAAFHLRVVLGEEPWLAQTHGSDWARYSASVPRWLW